MKIFSSAKIGTLELKNRIIRSGCFEGMCREGKPGPELLDHHRALALGGVGMTTISYCSVSRDGRAYGHEMWMRQEIIPDLARIVDAVHEAGAKVCIQLGHCGFFADGGVIGQRPIGPSRKFCTYRLGFSRSMDGADMERVREEFASSALMAFQAGFDAVEIHAGHGYLLSQFLSPWTNQRRDEFGGSLENRLRFPAEVIRRIKEVAGDDFPVVVKMNTEDGFPGGLTIEESSIVAKSFERAGADALIPSCGFTARTPLYMLRGKVPLRGFIKNQKNLLFKTGLFLFGKFMVKEYPFNEMFLLQKARRIKDAVKIPVILIGGVCSLDNMKTAMDEGFEFVQIGRPTIMEPDIVDKMRKGEVSASQCDHCNRCVASMDSGPVRCVTLDERNRS